MSSDEELVGGIEIVEDNGQNADYGRNEELTLVIVSGMNERDGSECNTSTYMQEPPISHTMARSQSERRALQLIECGNVVSIRNSKYIHVGIVGGWVPLNCPESFKFLAETLGADVPVNYATAAAPLFDKIVKLPCYSILINRSVCFKRRYAIRLHRDNVFGELQYITLENVDQFEGVPSELQKELRRLGNPIDRSVSVKGMSLMTIPNRIMIKQWQERISDWLDKAFEEHAYLLRWILGNALIDPCSNGYVLLMVGKSNSGKTSLINLITDVFSGTVGSLDGSYLTRKQQLKKSDLMTANSNRIIVGKDFEFGNTGINVGNIKDLTSRDPFSCGELTYSIRTTSFNSCNKVPIPVPATISVRAEIAKRFITISNKSVPTNEQIDTPYFSSEDKCMFIGECLLARIKCVQPPVSLKVFILSMYLGRYEELSKTFQFLDIDYTPRMMRNEHSQFCRGFSEDWTGMIALLTQHSFHCCVDRGDEGVLLERDKI